MTAIDNFVHSFIKMNNKSKEYFSRIEGVINIALKAGRALTQVYVSKLALIMDALKALITLHKKVQSVDVIRFRYASPLYPLTFPRRKKELYPSALEKLNISFLLNVAFVKEEISKTVSEFEERVGDFRFVPDEDIIRIVQRFTPLTEVKAIPPSLITKKVDEVPKMSLPSTQEYVKPSQPAFRERQRQVGEIIKIVETFAISNQMRHTLETFQKRYEIALPTKISEAQQLPTFIEEKIVPADLTRSKPSLSGISTTGIWRQTFASILEISSVYNVISSTMAGISYAHYNIPQALRQCDAFIRFISRIKETFKVYSINDQLRRVLENYSMHTTVMREAIAPPTIYASITAEERAPALLPELRPLASSTKIIGETVTKARSIQIYQALISALGTEIKAFRPEEPAQHIFPLSMWMSSAIGLSTLRLPRMISEAAPTLIVREAEMLVHEEIIPWAILTQALTAHPIAVEAQRYIYPSIMQITHASELVTLRMPRMISEESMETIPIQTLAQSTMSAQRIAFARQIVETFDLSRIYEMREAEIFPMPFIGLLTKLRKDRVDLGRLAFEDVTKIPSSVQILTPPTIAPTYQRTSGAFIPSRISQIQPSVLEPSLMKEHIRTIQNTINITVQATSLGDERDLRELRRKIEQIFAEEARRYFGSTLM